MSEATMSSDRNGTAGLNDATREALARMEAARERVRRRWFSPESMATRPLNVPEVIGTRDYENDPEHQRWRESSCAREQ
jgi:hypothetical protein